MSHAQPVKPSVKQVGRKVLVWSVVPVLTAVTLLPAVSSASEKKVTVSSDEGASVTITAGGCVEPGEPAGRCGTPPVAPVQVSIVPGAPCEPDVVAPAPFAGVRPTVDVALLLDTSNSMDGLIHQAKAQLWTIVRQFAAAEKQGRTPALRVALFEYGNSGLPAAEGYIRQVVPLTDDLDALSAALFALTTNGGDEYCGQVIDAALTRLDWSGEPNGYKAVFIAGNEPFTQGPVDYRDACKRAIESGVVVNTIHCGAYATGKSGLWHDGAQLAEGAYLNIDQDQTLVHVDAPQDKIIIELNAKLNETYLWFGAADRREWFARNQAAQDANAMDLAGEVAVQRAATKASSAYDNLGRDLVDSYADDETILTKLDDDVLPTAFRALTLDEREAKLKELTAQRKDLQERIAGLSAEREAYVAGERRRLAEGGAATLGDAVVAAVRAQLEAQGFDMADDADVEPAAE